MRAPAWMLFLGGIALLSMSAGIGLVIVSSKSRHALVRPDYYRDGLLLDAYRAREEAFDTLGVSLVVEGDRGGLLLRMGGPGAVGPDIRNRFAGLAVVLQLRRPDDPAADRDLPMTLASDAPPLWAADADPLRRGRWNARAVFSDSTGAPVMEREVRYDAP